MSSTEYAREITRVSVAKILQTIGWHTSNTSPLEILTDLTTNYIRELGKMTNGYANLFNCTDSNLDHLGLTFRRFNINLPELEEYVSNVEIGPIPIQVPNFPIPKENHLNFLKPGSKECVTRPVHIHEHLPPMFCVQEGVENETETPIQQEEIEDVAPESTNGVFKRPAELSPGENFKRPRLMLEEEGRPTREISSVIMTTSGFISPAREGKLPESRTPLATLEALPLVNVPAVANVSVPVKPKSTKRIEKKKDKNGKELLKSPEEKLKKIPPMKDTAKAKIGLDKAVINNSTNDVKPPPVGKPQNSSNKINKTLAAARLKTEKCNTTITPIPMKQQSGPPGEIKLFSIPDKRKANIFRKTSNVKTEKSENKVKVKEEPVVESREGSPVLVIDEPSEPPNNKFNIPNDITIELVESKPQIRTPEKLEKGHYGSDDSFPITTPTTPAKAIETIATSPSITKEKRKRKEKPRAKKVLKSNIHRFGNDFEPNLHPRTPEPNIDKHDLFAPMPFPPFPTFAPQLAPGLIPQNLSNPLFGGLPGLPLSLQRFRPPVPSMMMPPHLVDPPPILHAKDEYAPKNLVKKQPPPVVVQTLPIVIDDEDDVPKHEKKSKEHKKEKKDKIKKKNKKDKVKDKAEKKKLKEEKKEKIKKEKKDKKKDKELRDTDVLVPKLTFKFGSPTPSVSAESERKLNIKPVVKKEEEDTRVVHHDNHREMSPELARISALVTGQPKPKSASMIQNEPYPSSAEPYHNPMKKSMFKPVPKKEAIPEPINLSSPQPPSSYFEEIAEEAPVAPSPVKQGPGRPRIHPVKQKPVKAPKQQPPPPPPPQQQVPIKDAEGNQVWICPACGKQDDGSPMIGCDDCDAWYHWVCVGIQVPPDDSENWYCRHCLAKKQEVLQSADKKKKRKKREKKEH